MPDEKNDDFIDEWLNESDAPIVTRGFQPKGGPAEPNVAPPGRASLSPPEAGGDLAAGEQGPDAPGA
jgi:hypothetical protein